MPKLETLKAGDVLYDVHSERAGNTMLRRTGVWTVRILEVDLEKDGAYVSWNGNRRSFYPRFRVEKLRAKAPDLNAPKTSKLGSGAYLVRSARGSRLGFVRKREDGTWGWGRPDPKKSNLPLASSKTQGSYKTRKEAIAALAAAAGGERK
jgi:hypothetical protein